MLGNERLRVLPIWELTFKHVTPGAWPIATEKAKHNPDYQERHGILHGPADDLTPELRGRIANTAKRICRTLELDGYCRIDFRLSADGVPYYIEANPNPEIASSQEFGHAAAHAGLAYPDLLNRILALGISRARATGVEGGGNQWISQASSSASANIISISFER